MLYDKRDKIAQFILLDAAGIHTTGGWEVSYRVSATPGSVSHLKKCFFFSQP